MVQRQSPTWTVEAWGAAGHEITATIAQMYLRGVKNTSMWLQGDKPGAEEALNFFVHFMGDSPTPLQTSMVSTLTRTSRHKPHYVKSQWMVRYHVPRQPAREDLESPTTRQ